MSDPETLQTVQDQYGAVARSELSNDSAAVQAVARAFGYTPEDLASLPPQANMGLSCGNPVALAGLRPGEVVVDLGCGGGLDVLLAARRVGPTGRAIGIDMTPDMLDRARAGAAQVGATNVEFHLAHIDRLPLPDASVDCIISNCVINLVPDKPQVFREILRVLKPGGRLVVSDIALRQPLPPEIIADVQAYVGCIAGALLIADYERLLREAGFAAVVVQDTGADLNAYARASGSGCCSGGECGTAGNQTPASSSVHDGLAELFQQFDANEYAASVRVHALKPSLTEPEPVSSQERTMKTVQVYDKPLCCSTGVCGPEVDPVLPRFAADLQWLKAQGHTVERFNLAQQPQAFLEQPEVQRRVMTQGVKSLPIVVVDGTLVSQGIYPTREQLALWTEFETDSKTSPSPLPVVSPASSCCGGSSCC